MGYMDNVPLADALAGGPRTDLDDVVIDKPTPVARGVYRVPKNCRCSTIWSLRFT